MSEVEGERTIVTKDQCLASNVQLVTVCGMVKVRFLDLEYSLGVAIGR